MTGRGIGVAGVWLGVGLAIGLTGTGHANLPGWVYKGVLACATFVSAMLVGPWTWTKE